MRARATTRTVGLAFALAIPFAARGGEAAPPTAEQPAVAGPAQAAPLPESSSPAKAWFPDRNRARYFYASSALLLKQGQGYFSQKELLISELAYGVTDHVTVRVFSALPLWLVPSFWAVNLAAGMTVGFSPMEKLHLAASAESFLVPPNADTSSSSGFGGGFLVGSATYGHADGHLTLSVGRGFGFLGTGSYTFSIGDLLVVAAADYRTGRNVAVVTEHWVVANFASPSVSTAHALGVRLLGERWSLDLGLVLVPGMFALAPAPWGTVNYNFGD